MKDLQHHWARAWAAGDFIAVALVVLVALATTDRAFTAEYATWEAGLLALAAAFFAADLAIHLVHAAAQPAGVGPYLRTPGAWIDIAAVALPMLPIAFGWSSDAADLLPLLCMLKLGRFASGLTILQRVVRNSAEALWSVLFGFLCILLVASTLEYLFERGVQADHYGSVPLAMWWAIVTLTTTGYGDFTPVTLPGRALAGTVMICGIGVFALWAGILASGFDQELRRRDFLRTWDLVARVPLFSGLGADLIAEVARLLRLREFLAGQIIVFEGRPGEAMYFIVEGEVDVQLASAPVRLGHNEFFGEMALLSGAPRSATIVARERCQLLELGVAEFRHLAGSRPELMKIIVDASHRRAEAVDPVVAHR